MSTPTERPTLKASCHCGAVRFALRVPLTEVTACNCSLCRRLGVLWAYCKAGDVELPAETPTDTYAWNGRHVDFHRCRHCGVLTHWLPRDAQRTDRGVNARLFDPQVLAAARVRHRNGESDGQYLD